MKVKILLLIGLLLPLQLFAQNYPLVQSNWEKAAKIASSSSKLKKLADGSYSYRSIVVGKLSCPEQVSNFPDVNQEEVLYKLRANSLTAVMTSNYTRPCDFNEKTGGEKAPAYREQCNPGAHTVTAYFSALSSKKTINVSTTCVHSRRKLSRLQGNNLGYGVTTSGGVRTKILDTFPPYLFCHKETLTLNWDSFLSGLGMSKGIFLFYLLNKDESSISATYSDKKGGSEFILPVTHVCAYVLAKLWGLSLDDIKKCGATAEEDAYRTFFKSFSLAENICDSAIIQAQPYSEFIKTEQEAYDILTSAKSSLQETSNIYQKLKDRHLKCLLRISYACTKYVHYLFYSNQATLDEVKRNDEVTVSKLQTIEFPIYYNNFIFPVAIEIAEYDRAHSNMELAEFWYLRANGFCPKPPQDRFLSLYEDYKNYIIKRMNQIKYPNRGSSQTMPDRCKNIGVNSIFRQVNEIMGTDIMWTKISCHVK